MDGFNNALTAINEIIWHRYVLYAVLGTGVLFTIWSFFCQYRALTHGAQVVRGVYDDKDDPGAINHFQALSAALSATVGLGNIAGVAVAIALGGPGAVFWMWMIGLVGMALKTTEVTLSMIYRNTHDPDNPHGGPMFVAQKAMAPFNRPGTKTGVFAGVVFAIVSIGAAALILMQFEPSTPVVATAAVAAVIGVALLGLGIINGATLGKVIGGIFVITLLVSTITGGNMFQAWSVAEQTEEVLNIPTPLTGIILAVLVGLVIIGGIKRIGAVAGRLVPIMVAVYLLSAAYVLIVNIGAIPEMLSLIVTSAFSTAQAEGAFVGGVWGFAFLWGLKRALFSSEAGQGSSPIAHSAAKTNEPVREAVVAGLEPFIDTLVVCTLTSLVILSTGAWNRAGEAVFPEDDTPVFVQASTPADEEGLAAWTLNDGVTLLPGRTDDAKRYAGGADWRAGEDVFVIAEWGEVRRDSGNRLGKVMGRTEQLEDGSMIVRWSAVASDEQPQLQTPEVHRELPGPVLTSHAFDRVIPGFGQWMVMIVSWMFAISTMISWSYYGEQGVVFLLGDRFVLPYKFLYCLLAVVATAGFITTDAELDNLTALGTGVMLWANIPIMLIFGAVAMRTYHDYFRRMKRGELEPPHKAPPITEIVEGRDTE